MNINSHWVQFKGKFNVPEPPEREKYLIISGEFDHLNYQEKPNQDGSADAIYTVSPIRIMVQAGDKKLIAKVPKRSSQRLRIALWHLYQKNELPEELFDTYYNETMDRIVVNLPEVMNLLGINK